MIFNIELNFITIQIQYKTYLHTTLGEINNTLTLNNFNKRVHFNI